MLSKVDKRSIQWDLVQISRKITEAMVGGPLVKKEPGGILSAIEYLDT